MDLPRQRVIDFLPERSAASLAHWLEAHPGVKTIVRDRSNLYADGGRQGAPKAMQINVAQFAKPCSAIGKPSSDPSLCHGATDPWKDILIGSRSSSARCAAVPDSSYSKQGRCLFDAAIAS
jgi:hypothetical protein